jgi:YidC/Oxa1 family membrane protein insertase
MLAVIWNTILVNPIMNVLVGFYQLTGNLGISIVLLTVLIRALLIPVILPSMKTMKKQRDLQPEIDKLKKKYKHDKKKQAEMQMELFKKHGLNPASGCLTQISMLVVLIALYGVIRKFSGELTVVDLNTLIYFDALKFSSTEIIDTTFLYMDLAKPDPYYILAILAGGFQFLSSKMLQPFTDTGEKAAKKTPDKSDDIAYNMQRQMLYMMPAMTVIISLKLPAGAVLYIFITTLFSLVQQYFVSGLGGLKSWTDKLSKTTLKL